MLQELQALLSSTAHENTHTKKGYADDDDDDDNSAPESNIKNTYTLLQQISRVNDKIKKKWHGTENIRNPIVAVLYLLFNECARSYLLYHYCHQIVLNGMNLSIFDSLIALTFIKTFYELADNRHGSFFTLSKNQSRLHSPEHQVSIFIKLLLLCKTRRTWSCLQTTRSDEPNQMTIWQSGFMETKFQKNLFYFIFCWATRRQ